VRNIAIQKYESGYDCDVFLLVEVLDRVIEDLEKIVEETNESETILLQEMQ
jgi:hypothetical protein